MKNMLKSLIIPVLSFILLISYSCLTDEEKIERTVEVEIQELNELLTTIVNEGYDIDTTDLGVYYVVYEEGTGAQPKAGDTLTVEYVGAFIDGAVFDASANHFADGKWTFIYKEEAIIQGFENALSVMKKGGEVDAIIPSSLGYGITGLGVVPPYTTLIFNIKLNDILPVEEES